MLLLTLFCQLKDLKKLIFKEIINGVFYLFCFLFVSQKTINKLLFRYIYNQYEIFKFYINDKILASAL